MDDEGEDKMDMAENISVASDEDAEDNLGNEFANKNEIDEDK